MRFRMNLAERKLIQELLDSGKQMKDIAKISKLSYSAICRELRRNGGIRLYNAEKAQEKSDKELKHIRLERKGTIQKLTKRIEDLEKKLDQLLSLDSAVSQVAGSWQDLPKDTYQLL
jgi:IS30 family transposase